jgi:GntR family transcriptional regulator, transcriptional repressor for pyruvate dehydrogenase complex
MPQKKNAKISRQSLSAQIAERLVEEISNGTYKPGDMLPSEQALGEQFGVSRPVIREAISLLSAQSFIEVKNGLGSVVREVNDEILRIFFHRILVAGDAKSMLDLFEIRRALEILSVTKVAEHCKREELAQLKKTLDAMVRFMDNPIKHAQLDMDFHLQLAQFSRNVSLFHLIVSIRQTMISVNTSLRLELEKGERSTVQKHHEQIYAAIMKKDPAAASRAMNAHFGNVMKRLQRSMASD